MVKCAWLVLLLVTLLLSAGYWLTNKPQWYWQDVWISRDQQGQWYFARQQYAKAAQRFEHPAWQASAFYAAEHFATAAQLWSQQQGPVALFNRANALAHLRDYASAADSYKLALQLQPQWPQARANLELVTVLARQAEPIGDFSDQGKAQLAADDYVFEPEGSLRLSQAQDSALDPVGALSSEEIRALWLRRLQSTPADFLRRKFHYQLQSQQQP